jgi:uncharacterized membrane protein YjjP (DUF1212 family)
MSWKPWMTWVFFAVFCAVLAFLLTPNWPARVVTFVILSVPIALWARHQIRKNG